MQRHFSIFLAGAIAVSGAATSLMPAQAMPRIVPAVISEAAPGGSLQEVGNHDSSVFRSLNRSRGWRHCRRQSCWGGRRDWRPRDRHWRGRDWGHRHYDNFGGAAAAGIFGFAAGAIVGSALSGGGYGSSYHGACARKYRSYDPASGTYLGYDGYRHRCVLP